MANTNINPFAPTSEVPQGFRIADDLETNSAQWALSARQGMRLKEMASQAQPSKVPSLLTFGENSLTNIIYTIDDFMLVHDYVEGSTDNLKFSTDLGKTWTTVENTYGDIVNAFMFADGTFMMCTKKSEGCRVYWTRDFSTFTEATVLDYNGQPYSMESGKTRFFILWPKSYHTYVDGIEHYLFFDYIIGITTNPRMWYAVSDENGVTVRAAFAFGLSSINGTTLSARHGHGFEYNPNDGYFYALTGDAPSECHIIRGRHDANHVWTWEHLGTGGGYKLVSPAFDGGNMYAVTDYTSESGLGEMRGVVGIPITEISKTTLVGSTTMPARLFYLFHATSSFMAQGNTNMNAALTGYITDNNGWKFAGTDYLGGTKHMIAKGDHNFVWVDNDVQKKLGRFFGPNNRGEVYAQPFTPGYSVGGEGWLRISHRQTYNLTEAMRNSGATDFFDGWKGGVY